MMHGQAISGNEIYLLIKYIKSVLWSVAKCLSYIEEARCLKVNCGKSEATLYLVLVDTTHICYTTQLQCQLRLSG